MPQLTDILKTIHILDIVLILIIAGFALLGFTRGAVRLFIIMTGIYVGFLVGAIYYLPVSDLILSVFHVALSRVAQVLAFLLLNVVVAVLLIMLLFQFFGQLEIQGRVGACVDRPIGMLLGFLTGVLLTSILVIMLEVPYEIYNEIQIAGDQAPYLVWFHDWYSSSIMAPQLRNLLPVLLSMTTPMLGGNAPPILVKPGPVSLLPFGIIFGRM